MGRVVTSTATAPANLEQRRGELIELQQLAAKAWGLHPLDRYTLRSHLAAAIERISRAEAGNATPGELFALRCEHAPLLSTARKVLSTATGKRRAPAQPFYASQMPCPTCENTGQITPGVACPDCSPIERALFTASRPEQSRHSSPTKPAARKAGKRLERRAPR